MTASNLGIIFGPTLIKPRQADAEVSLSSLVDYPYQALIVELLIRHHQMIFDTPLSPLGSISPIEIDAHPRPDTRLNLQEKGQQLSRHSKSLGDIKEVISFNVKNKIICTTWIHQNYVPLSSSATLNGGFDNFIFVVYFAITAELQDI